MRGRTATGAELSPCTTSVRRGGLRRTPSKRSTRRSAVRSQVKCSAHALNPLDDGLRLIVIGQEVPRQIGSSTRIEDIDRRNVGRQHLAQASLTRGQGRDPAGSRFERYEAESFDERRVEDQRGVGEQPGLLGVARQLRA